MSISTKQYSALRSRLTAERDRLTQEVRDLQREGIEFTQDLANEDRSYGNHMADDASDTFEQERQAALQRNLETVLNEVNDALERMEQGTYGTCVDCGKEVPIERLEARPYAIRCIEDQEREDHVGRP